MNKVVFLTGSTGEIGHAIKQRFIEEGYDVVAPSRQEMDLESNQSIENFLQTLNAPADVFVHCAGFNEPKVISAISSHDIEKTMQINSMSFYKICHYLTKNQKINADGYILGVSSIYGFLSRKGRFSYSASKHCLNGMIKTLAIELGVKNIKVNAIAPGFVDTKMTRQNNDQAKIASFQQKIPLGRLAHPTDIANVAYFLCSKENQFLTGQEIVVDGGYSVGGFEQ
jgi:3-oxoacyl-[acyl-carrier protein] reductase